MCGVKRLFTVEDNELKRFARRNVIFYAIINVLINSGVPYFSFNDLRAVYLFQGEHSLARFLLPMALLLPFFVTYDILKKLIVLSEQGKAGIVFPENLSKNRFMLKQAAINGVISLAIIFSFTMALYGVLPEGYSFDGTWLSVFLGVLAGALAVIFTLWPIYRLRRMG